MYEHYVRPRTDTAWAIPELQGYLPPCPDETSDLQTKAMFSLFCLLLFKPWRQLDDLLRDASPRFRQGVHATDDHACRTEALQQVYR